MKQLYADHRKKDLTTFRIRVTDTLRANYMVRVNVFLFQSYHWIILWIVLSLLMSFQPKARH